MPIVSNRSIRSALFALLVTFVPIWTGGSGLCSDWTLVWSDEFAGPAGQPLESGNWDYDIGTGWGNAQLEYDTDRHDRYGRDLAFMVPVIPAEAG